MKNFVAQCWTGKKSISLIVSEEDKDLIESAPGDINVYLRDFHGYGNDYYLYPVEVKFIDIPVSFGTDVLEFFGRYVYDNGEYIESLIQAIKDYKEHEEFMREFGGI